MTDLTQQPAPTRLRERLFEDVSWYVPSPSWSAVVRTGVRHRTFRPVLTLRLVQAAGSASVLRLLLRVVHRRACAGAGVDLPAETQVGAGLKITHGWGLVVSPQARLGRRVVLMHGVTLGGSGGRRFPTVEDGVFVGPGAAVLGGVTVGRGAVIGAGCVVRQDVAPGQRLDAPEPDVRG